MRLIALKKILDCRGNTPVPTEDLENIKFVLENKKQISGTVIDTKFAQVCVCIFMDDFENRFLESQNLQMLVLFRFIDGSFFI